MPDMSERDRERVRRLMDGAIRGFSGVKGPCGCDEPYCGYCRIEAEVAAALTAARREQAEADAKLLDGFGEQCRGYAMRSNVFASEQSWLAQARHHEADAAAIRARTTGGE